MAKVSTNRGPANMDLFIYLFIYLFIKIKDLHVFMTFLCMISLRKTFTFFPSFGNANDRLRQERLLRSRNVATMVT